MELSVPVDDQANSLDAISLFHGENQPDTGETGLRSKSRK